MSYPTCAEYSAFLEQEHAKRRPSDDPLHVEQFNVILGVVHASVGSLISELERNLERLVGGYAEVHCVNLETAIALLKAVQPSNGGVK